MSSHVGQVRLFFFLFQIILPDVFAEGLVDTFLKTANRHCAGKNEFTLRGDVSGERECALLCLIHETCQFIEWDHTADTPCYLFATCSLDSHGTNTVYSIISSSRSWLHVSHVPDTPAMLSFDRMNFYGYDVGHMTNMEEDKCVLYCLLTDCVTMTYILAQGECFFKNAGGGKELKNEPGTNSYMRAVLAGCVPGYSCYALLAHENGHDKAQAR